MVAVMLVVAMLAIIGMVNAVGQVYAPAGEDDELIHDALEARGQTYGYGLNSYHGLAQRYLASLSAAGSATTNVRIVPTNMTSFTLTDRSGVARTYSIHGIPYMVGTRNAGGNLTTPSDLPYVSYVDNSGIMFTYIDPARINANGELLLSNGTSTGVRIGSVMQGLINHAGKSPTVGTMERVGSADVFVPAYTFTVNAAYDSSPDCAGQDSGRCAVPLTPPTLNPGSLAPAPGTITRGMPVRLNRLR